MNNLSKVFMGFAAVAMVACSNDEPAKGGAEQPTGPKGDVAYMTIRLNDVNAGSRAVTLPGTENGSHEEHEVSSALFLFFDADGAYAGKATPWNGGNDTDNPGDKDHNVEFKSNTIVVLEDLTGKDYPSFLMTILNAPDFTPEATMQATAKKLQNWNSSTTGNSFVMSTASYFGQDDARHEDDYYYVTKVTADDFRDQIGDTPANPEGVVDIYVERLAAKVEVKTTLPVNENGLYKINATVAGDPNGGTSVGTTDIYVRFEGWALSNITNNSYISKNIDGFDAAEPFADWNDAGAYRSFWSKSIIYDGFDASNVTRYGWGQIALNSNIKKEINGAADYCNENTMAEYADVPSQATTAIIAATACKADGTPLDLVRFNGLLFETKDYFSYILNSADASGKLNYWYKTGTTSTPVLDENGELQYDEDGNVVVNVTNTYKQFGTDEIKLMLVDANLAADRAVAVIESVTLPEVDGTVAELYTKNGDKYETATFTADDVKAALAAYIESKFKAVEAFNGGAMYYNIPVQHFMATVENEAAGNYVEGFYGVVRNHWYRLNINKIEKIGRGVFTPGDGTDENPGKPIVPEDPEEFFYLGATINILSWKIVDQDIDL